MLIYCNTLSLFNEENDEEEVLKSISSWLNKVSGIQLSLDQLRSDDHFIDEKKSIFISTFYYEDDIKKLYSINFSQPDKKIKGREWKVEIGIKRAELIILTIKVETFERSTLVDENPESTKPFLLKNLQENDLILDTNIGYKSKLLLNDIDEWKAFKSSIYLQERSFPLVLISTKKEDKKAFIQPHLLQRYLIGLAQVIEIDNSVNSRELENLLGSHTCAWDGAINIIFPVSTDNKVYNKLFLKNELNELNKGKNRIFRSILSYVTHITNTIHKSKHISSYDVKSATQKSKREQLKNQISDLKKESGSNEYLEIAEEAYTELEKNEEIIENLKKELEKIENEKNQKIHEISILNNKIQNIEKTKNKNNTILIAYGEEKDKYSDEIKNIVLNRLNELIKSNTVKKDSRSYHILIDVLNHNEYQQYDELLGALKNKLVGYKKINRKLSSVVANFNIEIDTSGEHNAFKFINDKRYTVTFGKSVSDYNAGKNIFSTLKNQLF